MLEHALSCGSLIKFWDVEVSESFNINGSAILWNVKMSLKKEITNFISFVVELWVVLVDNF